MQDRLKIFELIYEHYKIKKDCDGNKRAVSVYLKLKNSIKAQLQQCNEVELDAAVLKKLCDEVLHEINFHGSFHNRYHFPTNPTR